MLLAVMTEIWIGIAQAAVAFVAAFITSDLFDRVREARSISITRRMVGEVRGGARSWIITFQANRAVNRSGSILCYVPEIGNRFISFKSYHSIYQDRFSINDRGQIEVDVSFLVQGQSIVLIVHSAQFDVPQFFADNGSVKLTVEGGALIKMSPARVLLEAHWRMLWVMFLFFYVALVALGRIIYLAWASF